MVNEVVEKGIEEVRDESIQPRAHGKEGAGAGWLRFPVRGGNAIISPWWSRTRDSQLLNFWRRVDVVAGAIYAMQSKLTTIPLHVEPRDLSLKTHHRQAEMFTRILVEESEFAVGGWMTFFEKWIESLLGQDNGTFGEIIGAGPKDGPIEGPAMGLAYLDSSRCIRTSDPEYPVIYQSAAGEGFSKFHYTRVLAKSQMTSTLEQMHNVGFCAVSRCINIAQNVYDQMIYKQEKMGSRPQRGIIIGKGGLTTADITNAFAMAELQMDSKGLTRYSNFVVIGSSDLDDAGIDFVDLASMPEGFSEKDSMTISMASIALAFGVDPREIWPATTSGATRAESVIQHIKQRGKAPGQILAAMEGLLNYKFLPAHLKVVFDFQDDMEDEQSAKIWRVRAESREKDIMQGTMDVRTVREKMLGAGELTKAQFLALELEDGRLENGEDILSLFVNPAYDAYLTMDGDPFEMEQDDAVVMINNKRVELWALRYDKVHVRPKSEITEALAALDALERFYMGQFEPEPEEVEDAETSDEPGGTETADPSNELMSDDEVDTDTKELIAELDLYAAKAKEAYVSGGDLRFKSKRIPRVSRSAIASRVKEANSVDEIDLLFESLSAVVKGNTDKVQPKGAGDDPIPMKETLTPQDVQSAVDQWDEWMRFYAGILDAEIEE